jgi:hypothetical protein
MQKLLVPRKFMESEGGPIMPKGMYCGRCGKVWKRECECQFPKSGFPMVMEVKPNTSPGVVPEVRPVLCRYGV